MVKLRRPRGSSRPKFVQSTAFEEVLFGLGWKKYRIENVCLFIGNKDSSCRKTWMKSKWPERRRQGNQFLTTYIWDLLNVKVKRTATEKYKKTQQFYKVSTPCLDDHNFKKEELEAVGELSTVCSRIVLQCLNLGTYWWV